MVLEKTLECVFDSNEIKPVNQIPLKEISPEYFIRKSNAEAETPILWPPDVKN